LEKWLEGKSEMVKVISRGEFDKKVKAETDKFMAA
jgi:hypothetical protein